MVDDSSLTWPMSSLTARFPRLLCPAAAAVLLVGCGGGEAGGWAGSVDILENGTVRVENPAAGVWTEETRPRDATGWGYRWPGRFDREGRLLDFIIAGEPDDPFRGVVVRSSAGQALDTVHPPASVRDREFFRIERANGRTVRPVPYSAYGDWTISRDGTLWATPGDPYRVLELTVGGDTARILEREHSPVSVAETELDSIREEFVARYGEAADQVDFSRIPGEKPALRAVFVARGGRVWALPYGRRGETGRLADVFTPDGRYLGRLELPVRLRWSVPPVGTGDALYGVRRDPATGVDQVVRIAIGRNKRWRPS